MSTLTRIMCHKLWGSTF